MRLLLYKWGANNEDFLESALVSAQHDVIYLDTPCRHYTRDMELGGELIKCIKNNNIDGVISFNYFPIISLACDVTGTTYYSWVYDNPHRTLAAKTVGLECNRIGIFDRGMVEELKNMGINTAFHLPLAVDTKRFSEMITAEETGKYENDVSFVGSLYSGDNNFFDKAYSGIIPSEILQILSESLFKMDISAETEKFCQIPAGLAFIKSYMAENGLALGEDYHYDADAIAIASAWERKITSAERITLMKKLSKMPNVKFALYTESKTDIPNCGIVNYETEMPLVFNRSRININLSLKSIHSGIPLRVLDIMACGGFVLTNRQPELMEHFIEDEEIVYFSSPEECMEKIKFFLANEEERKRIAMNGQKKVASEFSYSKMLEQMLSK